MKLTNDYGVIEGTASELADLLGNIRHKKPKVPNGRARVARGKTLVTQSIVAQAIMKTPMNYTEIIKYLGLTNKARGRCYNHVAALKRIGKVEKGALNKFYWVG